MLTFSAVLSQEAEGTLTGVAPLLRAIHHARSATCTRIKQTGSDFNRAVCASKSRWAGTGVHSLSQFLNAVGTRSTILARGDEEAGVKQLAVQSIVSNRALAIISHRGVGIVGTRPSILTGGLSAWVKHLTSVSTIRTNTHTLERGGTASNGRSTNAIIVTRFIYYAEIDLGVAQCASK